MNQPADEAISKLNGLIETCRDGEYGFREAARHVHDDQAKQVFDRYAQQRHDFASELGQELRRMGAEPREGGTVSGSLHRGWMTVKDAVTGGGNDHAIVAEAERGEDTALERYQDALNADLPTPVRSTVQRQYTEVRQAHDHVRALEKALERE